MKTRQPKPVSLLDPRGLFEPEPEPLLASSVLDLIKARRTCCMVLRLDSISVKIDAGPRRLTHSHPCESRSLSLTPQQFKGSPDAESWGFMGMCSGWLLNAHSLGCWQPCFL